MSEGTKGSTWNPSHVGVWSSDSCVRLGIDTIPPLSLEKCVCSAKDKVSPDPKSKASSSQILCQTTFSKPGQTTAQQLLKSVHRSLELLLLHPVFCCLLNYKLLFLSLCLAVALSVSLSHCLTLLSDYCEVLKRNQRGICAPLCRSVPVLSVAASSHLILHFCPSRHTHTHTLTHTQTHTCTHAHTTTRAQRELNFGCLCVSCARCKAKRCLTSSPPP